MKNVPPHLQGILWSSRVDRLDLEKDKSYIIHQVLMYGSLKDIDWLFEAYPIDEIKRIFCEEPQPIYTKPAFNFINKFILKLDDQVITNGGRYIKRVY